MFAKLEKLLRFFGGRCIIVEDGEPRYVVLPVRDYLLLQEGNPQPADEPARADPAQSHNRDDEGSALQEANRTIELISKQTEVAPLQPPEAPAGEYRIEDIPF